jgi:4-amino-4-deoxy-L-arabinose transferase-like glycosyltransferase
LSSAGAPSPTTPADRRALAWLLLAGLVVLGAGIGLRDPWPSDEPRFALVAKQMVESGDWLFPRRGSELYPDKPPMLMWLQALAYQVTGQWRIAFMLPSLLAGLGTLWLVWDLGRRLWSPRAGLLAAVAVLSAFMFSFQFKRAQIDPLITFLITLANWGLLRHLLLGPHWRAYWLGCFVAGLGVITKGVGAIALLMLVPYALARRRGWQGLAPTNGAAWRWAGGALAFLAAIALWVVPMVAVALSRGTPEYLEYARNILFDQTARRYAGQVGGHQRPIWYFVPVVLLHFFPLSLAYLAGWRDARARWRERDGRVAVLAGWCALVFLFFSLAGGKREVYLLPMLPMLALLLAPTLERIAEAAWLHRTALAAALLLGLGLAATGAAGLSGHWARMQAIMLERGLHAEELTLAWTLVAGAGAIFLVAAAVWRARRGMHALLAGLAGLWIVWGVGIAPRLNDSVSAAEVMRAADAIAGGSDEIALVAWKEQNLLMSPRPLKDFGFRREPAGQFERATAWLAEAPDRRWIFAQGDVVQACVERDRVRVAGWSNRRQWWMFRLDAVRPDCRLPSQREAPDDD